MKIEFSKEKLKDIKSDVKVVFVIDKKLDGKWIKHTDKFELYGYSGGDGESIFMQDDKVLYVGIEKLDASSLRDGCATAIRYLKSMKFTSIKLGSYIDKDSCPVVNLKAMVEGFILGDYTFDTYKSDKSKNSIETITISISSTYDDIDELNLDDMNKYLKEAITVSEAVNYVRELINTTPDDFTPVNMAKVASKVAKDSELEAIIIDENGLKERGMNAFAAVGRASSHPPRLVHLIYKPKKPIATIFLIGKGLTYDSGGLSLKPSDYMVTMKADKSGACAVLGVMSILKELNAEVEVHGILGMAENMIGGNAYKPDDILTAKNGKTIEVRNTDAEGRLVLADCFCYIQDYAKENNIVADYMIDMATLTGACVVGIGEYTIGVMGHNDDLKNKIMKVSTSAGELTANLPFNKYLKKLIKSEVADVCNISSSRYGGAITAGLFLSEFVYPENRDKWVHLDIAGPAFVEKQWGVNPIGANGAGVRTIAKFIKHLELENSGFFK